MRRLISILIFLVVWTYGSTQKPTIDHNEILTVDQMKEDLELLRNQLEELHTGLYSYSSEKEFEEFYAEILLRLDEPMNAMEFFREIVSLNSIIKNGHTNIGFPVSFREALSAELLRLPLSIHRGKNGIRVLRSTDRDYVVPNGAYLISINGESVAELFEEFQSKATRDGYIETGTEKFVEGYFSYNYAMLRGNPDKYRIVIKDEGGERELSIDGIALKEVREIYKERYGEPELGFRSSDEPALTLDIEDKTAVITIKTFDESTIKKRNKKSSKWFRTAFEEMEEKEVSELIIDMRGNGGGDQAASIALMSHLVHEEFTFYDEIYVQKRKIRKAKLYGFDARILNMTAWLQTKKQNDNKFTVNLKGTKPLKSRLPYFDGNIYVLTDGDSFSQTGETSGSLKENTKAIFIGTSPGGSPCQNISGIMLPLVLPHSKIRVSLPIVLWKMNVSFGQDGSPLEMDYEVRPSYKDKIDGIDREMRFTKDLISKHL